MTITVNVQRDLESLINQYNSIDIATLKSNIIREIDKTEYGCRYIANWLGVDIQTIYSWRQPQKRNAVDFESALRLCNILGINITELMN